MYGRNVNTLMRSRKLTTYSIHMIIRITWRYPHLLFTCSVTLPFLLPTLMIGISDGVCCHGERITIVVYLLARKTATRWLRAAETVEIRH